jgi:2-C-methyl-D-erythritol 4-phosphate cytidylyltransferase
MAVFAVVILTAAPAGLSGEAGGALVKLDGREVLLKAVELFLNRDEIKQIQVAFVPEFMEEAKRKFASHFGFSGVRMCFGGPKWGDQIAAAQTALAEEATHVILHDGARPAVPYTDIEALLEEAPKHPAIALASAVRSTLVEVDEGGNPLAFHAAGSFMNLATPQVFRRDKFLEMASKKSELHPSELRLLRGSPLNVRLGGGADSSLAKAMLHMMPKPKLKASNPFEEAQW